MTLKKISDTLQTKVLGYGSTPIPNIKQRTITGTLEPFGLDKAKDESDTTELAHPEDLGTVFETLEVAVEALGRVHIDRLMALASIDVLTVPDLVTTLPGFHKWTGDSWRPIEGFPDNLCYVLDTETVRIEGEHLGVKDYWVPTVCVGVAIDDTCTYLFSPTWYLWIADLSVEPQDIQRTFKAPQGSTIVGYNAPYDRQWLTEEYLKTPTGNRFFDLMSAHIATRGQTNQQRLVYKTAQKDADLAAALRWYDETSTNGLDAVYKLHTGKTLDKGVRGQIVDLGLPWVSRNLAEVVKYCLLDVQATTELAGYIIPELRLHQPSDISWTGQLLIGSAWLPMSADRFPGYYDRAEEVCDRTLDKVNQEVAKAALETAELYQGELLGILDVLKGLPRTSRADKVAELTLAFTQTLPKPLQSLDWTPATTGKNKGLPAWIRKGIPKLSSTVTPLLLGMTWLDKPILWGDQPFQDDQGNEVYQDCYYTDRDGAIPHPETRGKRVTSLFSKGFVSHVETGALAGNDRVKDLLTAAMSTVNWVSLRKRVYDIHSESLEGFPVVLPQISPTGTITRRCADSLWQVMANPKSQRIGTELKTMIEAPQGYKIFGADVDSEELWLASAMGDSLLGFCGSSPLGLMTLIGVKEQGTDVHSVVAKQLGISRDLAKNLVYAAIYGLGVQGAQNYLMKALPSLSTQECNQMAQKFVNTFKGHKYQYTGRYVAGLASEFFNYAEGLVGGKVPETPVLGARLSKALSTAEGYKTTKVNWVVQSSGSDYRDLTVTLFTYLCELWNLDARLLLTIHDEFRFLVADQDVPRACQALQTVHLMTRGYIIDRLGLNCIPSGIAYHSEVDLDHVLRKSTSANCITPSQPEPLPLGVSLKPRDL